MATYVDTSALVKLVVAEEESSALRAWLEGSTEDAVTSDLSRTELMRAVRRAAPDRVTLARQVLDTLTVLQVRTEVFESAGRLDPATLHSLDAVHLASALDLGDDLTGIITYDERLAEAAHALGIQVFSPVPRRSQS